MQQVFKVCKWTLAFLVLCSSPAYALEGQAWKTQDEHMHEVVDVPFFTQFSSPQTLNVSLLLHNAPTTKHVNFLDLQDGSNTIAKTTLNTWGDGSPEQAIPTMIALDPSKFAHSGYQEVRLRFNGDKPDREFITTRWCVYIDNGKSRSDYCGGPTTQGRCGAGAWYPDIANNYRIVFVDCRNVNQAQVGTFAPGSSIRVKAQDGNLFCNLDPHFHQGDPGVVLLSNGASNTWTSVKLPAVVAPGAHKLHCRSQTGVEAGAFVLPLTIS